MLFSLTTFVLEYLLRDEHFSSNFWATSFCTLNLNLFQRGIWIERFNHCD
jgi:hypothetical protein